MESKCLHHRSVLFVELLCLSAASICAPQDRPTIRIDNPSNYDRSHEWIEFGVPFPREWDLASPEVLLLQDESGSPIPSQYKVSARWGSPIDSSAPVKWLHVAAQASLPASSSILVSLDRTSAGPPPADSIKIDEATPGKIIIDTGAALFELNDYKNFNLFHQATIGGRPLLIPLSAREAISYTPDEGVDIVDKETLTITPRTTNLTIEQFGAFTAVVKAEGSLRNDASEAVLDFTARLHFFYQSAAVFVDFTVENNHPIIEGEWGQPGNAYNQGDPYSVYIGGLTLSLQLNGSGASSRFLAENDLSVTAENGVLTLYQDSSGTEFWDVYTGEVGWPGMEASAHPRLQSYCGQNGFTLSGEPLADPLSGRQSQGWMTLIHGEDPAPRLTVAVRDFWQNFPKEIQASADGRLSVNLFPHGETFHHNFRVGEEKTHTILFDFGIGAMDSQQAAQIADAFQHPLTATVSPQWILSSKVLGEVPPVDPARWPEYEDYVRTALEPSRIFDPVIHDPNFGNTSLLQSIERYNIYGWQDNGDIPLDYEAFGENQAGQMNLKYWFLYGLFIQYCRSGDPAWLTLARPGARHIADIDHLHIPDEGIQHWAHGAYFGHSQHDEPGNLNPNRNSNSPSVDLVFGVPGLILGYYLTGETRFAEVVLEALQSYRSMSEFAEFDAPVEWESVIQRGQANLIFAYMEGYKFTGDYQWFEQLNRIVQPLGDLSNKGWTTDPGAYGAEHPGYYLRMFMFNQVLWTLGRYLDFLQEYGLPDEYQIAAAMQAYGDFVIDFVMQEYPPGSGRAVHPYDFVFDGSDPSYLDVNNWALVMADALAYIYKYTGEQRFLDAAERFYRTGAIDPVFEGDPPVYLGSKDLVNALNWGMVYMNQANQAAFIPRSDWMVY
ncbi:MAG: hypothetical protein JXR73_20670 [Candidatus Omnitrophica bacterium]|nr:hypothetical protein [Candidatus Omnitrophota bacterium]